ncbi:diguanylate cyclase domain-containing protein [Methylobacterium sp. A54F]
MPQPRPAETDPTPPSSTPTSTPTCAPTPAQAAAPRRPARSWLGRAGGGERRTGEVGEDMAEDMAEALAGMPARQGWRLGLPPRLEAFYEAETRAARTRHIRAAGLAGIACHAAMAALLCLLLPDVRDLALGLLGGLDLAVFALVLAALSRPLPGRLREGLAAAAVAWAGLTGLFVVAASAAPLATHGSGGAALVLVFCATIFHDRLRPAAAVCACLVLASALPALQPAGASLDLRLWLTLNLAVTALCVLGGIYLQERSRRRAWLDGVRQRLDGQVLARANALLRDISARDPLTNLANRRSFDAALSHGIAAAKGWLAVILIDVDHFKLFNDRYGHPAGDACLRRVGEALSGEVRAATDTLARYGGEEFVVVLPGLDPASARRRAEALRAAVARLGIPHADGVGGIVTVSVGAGVGLAPLGLRPDALLDAADAALYSVKRAGRNGIRVRTDARVLAEAG